MNKQTPKVNLTDMIIDDILEMNNEELDDVFESMDLSLHDEIQNLNSMYSNAHLLAKKQILLSARKEIDASQTKKTITTNQNSIGIKDRLTDMMIKGLLPAELTMAFRDGKEITDEEALSIYKDLIELGVDMDD